MIDTITIRASGRSDLADVDALLARSYPRLLAGDYPPSVMVTALPIISRARPELVTSGTYYLAVDPAGRVIGAGGWTTGAPEGGARKARVGHIRHFVTDDRAVRRGIGRALMAHVLREAGDAGVTMLDCLSTRMAVPFYAAMGFTEVARVTVPLRPGIEFPAVRMQRLLPG
jgi:GNAT superfamily N-acetyltransferase